ncbi:MAG: hypothetical protein IK104_09600 [Clostridia bacterium]|nr:hypothetical protein [Clostridia bacterium]
MEFTRLPEEFGALPEEIASPAPPAPPAPEFGAYGGGSSAGKSASTSRHKLLRRMMSLAASVSVVSMAVGLGPLGLPFPDSDPLPESPAYVDTDTPGSEQTGPGGQDEPGPGQDDEPTTEPVDVRPAALQEVPDGVTVRTFIILTKYETEKLSFDSAEYYAYGEEGQELAKQWAISQDADWSKLEFVQSTVSTETVASPDAIIIGDPDDLENAYIAQGTVERKTVRTDYYDLEIPLPDKENGEEPEPILYDDAFPPLPNLAPQTYDIQGYGSEHYIRFMDGDYDNWKYLIAGTYWTESEGHPISTVPGASYDLATNTLTLNNFTGPALDVNLMGNGFTINLIGVNRLAGLQVWGFMYGGSVTITGSGTLILNEGSANSMGLVMNAEWSQSCLMIDREATLEVYGSEQAIGIFDTTMPKSIYFLKPVQMTGSRGYQTGSDMEEGTYNGVTFEEGTVQPAKHVRFAPVTE